MHVASLVSVPREASLDLQEHARTEKSTAKWCGATAKPSAKNGGVEETAQKSVVNVVMLP